MKLIVGDCREMLRALPAESVHCCVTSPPYFGLRDYGHAGQIGLEPTPDEFVAALVGVFREVRRVLRDDGTVFLNLGDSYASTGGERSYGSSDGGTGRGPGARRFRQNGSHGAAPPIDTAHVVPPLPLEQGPFASQTPELPSGHQTTLSRGIASPDYSLKPKDLIGIPWRVAFALQADGWYLRQDIIWHKPNPMPESVRDRCTKSHEYIFLLSKREKYYFDSEAIAEPLAASSVERLSQSTLGEQAGSARVPGKTNGNMKAVGPRFGGAKYGDDEGEEHRTKSGNEWTGNATGRRNRRSVWTVTTKPFKGAHFATFPPDLIEPCVLAGAPVGGTVLDPFNGAGTTGLVAMRHGRKYIGIELNPEYAKMSEARWTKEMYG